LFAIHPINKDKASLNNIKTHRFGRVIWGLELVYGAVVFNSINLLHADVYIGSIVQVRKRGIAMSAVVGFSVPEFDTKRG
jgi:hypothetical protein